MSENVNVSAKKTTTTKKWLLLCRLKCSEPELPSSTGVTNFILRLSFPSCSTEAGSSPSLLSSTEISLVAIVVSLVTSASDGSENEVISAKHHKGMKKMKTHNKNTNVKREGCAASAQHTDIQTHLSKCYITKRKGIPTNRSAVPRCLFQLTNLWRSRTHCWADQLAIFGQCKVKRKLWTGKNGKENS